MTDAPGPVWQRIAQTLGAEIVALPPGDRLPTEAALARRFGVNRHTVRRAVESLVRQGRVRVEQGRGAFVAEDVLDYAVSARTRFSEWVRRENKVPDGRILRLREMAAEETVAAGLGIPPGATVAHLARLGLADGVPIALSDHYFPAERLPGIAGALASRVGITQALAAVGIDDYLRQATRVAARMPTEWEADLLQLPPHRPLLACENVNVDRDGRVIEFCIARYPSNRVQIVFEPT